MLSPPGLELRRTKYVVIYFTPECLTSVTVVPAVVWLLKIRLVVCHCKNRAQGRIQGEGAGGAHPPLG